MTLVFLLIGGFSVLLLALSFVGGHIHVGHFQLGGGLGLPVLAGFTGAFGFGGAIGVELSHNPLIGVVVGLTAAIPVGWLTGRLVRAAQNIRTDETLTSAHLIGATGVLVTPLTPNGYGAVKILIAGGTMRLNARCDQALPRGTSVLVIDTVSATCVQVAPTPQYFSKDGQ